MLEPGLLGCTIHHSRLCCMPPPHALAPPRTALGRSCAAPLHTRPAPARPLTAPPPPCRPGTLLLEFASQVPGRERTYNWEDKLTIGLSPTELHDIILAPAKGVSVFHDPGKGGPSEGAVTKRFEFKAGTPGSYFMTLTVTDKTGGKAGSVSHSLSAAEFSVFTSIVQFLTPRLLGFDQVFE